ncbi:DUF4221 domain-containing protein [Bacteroides intestinalis]|nr:DUF4221 family protein [Bacteroides intestinalis]RGK25480.1 DUF4221 domain-containing protein [Bacteroides intestinalis]RHI32749.1 DUF4221 domain-containing protein [Bacteroides intestinalis]RHN06164.1 DUF4221 domain-containing protein [Bacteroides intestinalis]
MSVKLAMTIIDLSAMHPLIVSRMSVRSHFLLLVCFSFLISCQFAGNKKEIGYGEEVQLNVKEVVVPSSDVLNLKSYYLSFVYQSDSLQMLYGYNYKIHGLDCFNLKNMQSSQITFLGDGNSAVVRPVTGLYVQSLDSIWIYDGSQRALLLDRQGQLLNAVNLRDGLTSNEQVLIDCNFAISTSKLYYDGQHKSLLYGIQDTSTSPYSFKVREASLNGSFPPVTYLLQSSVSVSDVSGGDYGNMSGINISFSDDDILYNYPVESHVYVLDRRTKQTKVIDADSRFTKNVAGKCRSRSDYSQWIRHAVENPHFYDVMYLPEKEMYVRLHLGEHTFDATLDADALMDDRNLYLTLFDKELNVIGESRLAVHRYNYYTAWTAMGKGILVFVDNLMSSATKTDKLEMDVIEVPMRTEKRR